jgi:hypothetical protein
MIVGTSAATRFCCARHWLIVFSGHIASTNLKVRVVALVVSSLGPVRMDERVESKLQFIRQCAGKSLRCLYLRHGYCE